MKFIIKHEIKGRIRVHFIQQRMTRQEADVLQYYLTSQPFVTEAKVQPRVQDAAVCYRGGRQQVIEALKKFRYSCVEVPQSYLEHSSRELNDTYWEKLVNKVVFRAGSKLFLPYPIRAGLTAWKSVRYLWHGVQTLAKGKITC